MHRGNLLRITGIGRLRDVVPDLFKQNRCGAPIPEADLGSLLWAELNPGDDGSNWNRADGEQCFAQEMVEEATLAGLEAPEDRDVECLGARECAATLQEVPQVRDLVTVAEFRGRLQ